MRTGIANLPLHGGKCPSWLFAHMKELAPAVIRAIAYEYGTEEVLKRLSDPIWFQAFGCLLGFDWHASGVTTTVCGAIKEGIKPYQDELGIYFAGGKGKTSRRTPMEIDTMGEKYALPNELSKLKYASYMAAKVDSTALQDGYQIYHHFFVFTADGSWSVVQQGMNNENGYARRYHWLSKGVKSFVCEPHSAICSDNKGQVLNLVAGESEETRKVLPFIAREKPEEIVKFIRRLENNNKNSAKRNLASNQLTLNFSDIEEDKKDISINDVYSELNSPQIKQLSMPRYHAVPNSHHMNKILIKVYEQQPENFETLLAMPGLGPGTLRALTMMAEVVHGVKASYRDPVRYSFAHGGKDGFPYPVNQEIYTSTIRSLENALEKAKIGDLTKIKALKRLGTYQERIIK